MFARILAAALWLLAAPAWAQMGMPLWSPANVGACSPGIAFVNAANGGFVTATSQTISYTVGAGSNELLVASVEGDLGNGNDDVSGVTYNSVAMTLLAKTNPGSVSTSRFLYFFYLLGPASGAHNLVVTAGSSHFLQTVISEYSGVKQTTQPDASNSQVTAALATTQTTSVTTVTDGDWVIMNADGNSGLGSDPTAGAGSTRRARDTSFGGNGLFDSAGPVTPPGSYSMTVNWTNANAKIAQILGAFKCN